MKSLIRKMSFAICTLLLTCTFCLAQTVLGVEKIEDIVKVYNGESDSKSVGSDTTIVMLMIEYETECYNDSAKHTYSVFESWGLGINGVDELLIENPEPWISYGTYLRDSVIYHHKQPDFADFVRWAAKKYGL